MVFLETRGHDKNNKTKKEKSSFLDIILDPSASFGGLFVPEKIPKIPDDFIEKHINSSYQELALDIVSLFELDINEDILKNSIKTYNKFDDINEATPLKNIDNNLFCLELYHGPTRAFKDMALQPFGELLSAIALKQKQNYLIVVATSGDTGPATIEAFANKENIKIICLYPNGGTSDMQELQMVSTNAKNVKVLGINGSFDDAQNLVKKNLKDNEFKKLLANENIKLTAANSVNFARILFQIIYNFYAYIQLVKQNHIKNTEQIDVTIPSGNFGNALGAYYAKNMGLQIDKINIASNSNSVLTSLINDGKYDLRNRSVIATNSPAMDILKSSNIERVLYHLYGATRTRELLENLDNNNYFELNENELKTIQKIFTGYHSNDDYCKQQISNYFKKGYLLDPHTATCLKAYNKDSDKINIIYSTAEWSKFSTTIINSIEGNDNIKNDLDAINKLEKKYSIKLNDNISNILDKKISQKNIVNIDEVSKYIFEFINK
jgi:threonine synthase